MSMCFIIQYLLTSTTVTIFTAPCNGDITQDPTEFIIGMHSVLTLTVNDPKAASIIWSRSEGSAQSVLPCQGNDENNVKTCSYQPDILTADLEIIVTVSTRASNGGGKDSVYKCTPDIKCKCTVG
jgi:hypothetical protein